MIEVFNFLSVVFMAVCPAILYWANLCGCQFSKRDFMIIPALTCVVTLITLHGVKFFVNGAI